jgi:hypothetical protein
MVLLPSEELSGGYRNLVPSHKTQSFGVTRTL